MKEDVGIDVSVSKVGVSIVVKDGNGNQSSKLIIEPDKLKWFCEKLEAAEKAHSILYGEKNAPVDTTRSNRTTKS